MDNQRLLVWALFGLMAWFTYQAWQQDYGPRPQPRQPAPVTETADPLPAADELPELPEAATDPSELPVTDDEGRAAPAEKTGPSRTVRVLTDVLEVEIDMRGATLVGATLRKYPVAKDRPDVLVQLLSNDARDYGLIRTGLRAAGGAPAPGHTAEFETPRTDYRLTDEDELVVPFRWVGDDGISVEKRLRFRPGSYVIEVEQELRNNGDTAWRGDAYTQILRRSGEQERSMFNVDSYSFDGPIIYDGDSSEKLDHDELVDKGPYEYRTDNGWLASIEHHFLRAAIPERGKAHAFRVQVQGNVAVQSVVSGRESVAPGGSHRFDTTLFVGPKLQSQLEELADGMKLTVDYGWLTIISQPLFWLLAKVHGFVGNWGVAIVIVTILIKLAFYKLTEASGRSMAKMRNLQPRLKALQERYKDDRQQLSQAMMELYKREQVNPAAGCLPILIQMPFFLAFYWVLLESVEMRQAPFALWITDLSSRDPYFILPLIMGAAMYFQQKLNPQVGDPVQVKVMQIMPVIFTVFFAFFPSGLVLYWVTNTVLSIAQQWKINTVVEKEEKLKKSGKKSKGRKKSSDAD